MVSNSWCDLALLRRFEPVIRYTRGERFFPLDVDRYIQNCSLWLQHSDGEVVQVYPQGELSVENLIETRPSDFGSIYYLRFIEDVDVVQLARYSIEQYVKTLKHREDDELFRAGLGRLARVGVASRLVDALFSVTLLMRGRVPGTTALAAALAYRKLLAERECYTYYGRVVRENGWSVLQYWYFYPFNNWRSGFFGLNDHEGDWEMVSIYCAEDPNGGTQADNPLDADQLQLTPYWVAYASHDFSGDDLRRRWDDSEVEKVLDRDGNPHPVVYAGAGSHASYFSPGEYLAELELSFLSPIARFFNKIQDLWVNVLHQFGSPRNRSSLNVFRVPFVDYARGDGFSIGPGQKREWEVQALDDTTPWASHYRGLWGLYAHDPIAGENAPGGPVFNRDGSVRRSWYDPLGWAGMDKVLPPCEALQVLDLQRQKAVVRASQLEQEISQKRRELAGLGLETSALEGSPHLAWLHDETAYQVGSLSRELADLRKRLTVEKARLEAFAVHERRLRMGEQGPLRAHIHRAHRPSSELDLRLGRVAEGFAAISIGGLMIGIVLLIVFARHYVIFGLAAMIGLLIFIEAGFRRQLSQLISSLVIGLAVVSAFILLFEFFWQVIFITVLSAGLFIIWENIREVMG